MKILVDRNIPYIRELFGLCNQIKLCEGRIISAKSLQGIDILIVRSITKVNAKLLSKNIVKFVGSVTAGVDHIDQDFLKKCGVVFTSAPGSNAIAVVEYVFTALFWLAKRNGFFLRDKTVGIVGVGRIGNLLYQRLRSFGVHTLLCDPFLSTKNVINGNWKSLEELVSEANILTFHTPLTYNGDHPTWHMINMDVLDALPSNTILVNTCRGAVIDNSALLKIFEHGKKLNVVLDVWESEPDISLSLLSYIDIGTSHIAGYTVESKIRGIIYIYNEYCKSFDISSNISRSLLSLPTVRYIEIRNNIDEFCLHQLIQYMYDIYLDNILFRNWVVTPGGFDKLRRFYLDRREWSFLCVRVYSEYNYEILSKLGFDVCLGR